MWRFACLEKAVAAASPVRQQVNEERANLERVSLERVNLERAKDELRRAWLRRAVPPEPPAELAPFAEQEAMFAHLHAALVDVHFLYGDKADALWHGVRHLLGRAGLSPMEVQLLHGLARQLRWIASKSEPRRKDNNHGLRR